MMEIYKVGGAVRDELMGAEAKDVDWVVEGATPEMMLELGYRPVGKDFPVFHHPETQEEHALARTERKSGRGYGGFTFDAAPTVTLEEDLGRRDLTINSMARRKDGTVVDPYNGQADLANKVLRHTTEAFQEDPVRLLRVARFLARFGPEWSVAPETLTLLQNMVENGEVDFLVPERVWKEFEKGLSEDHPLLMLQFLDKLKVFERPPFAEYRFDANSALLKHLEDRAAKGWKGISQRFALAFARMWSPSETKVSRIPSDVREVTHLFQFCLNMQKDAPYENRSADQRLAFIEATDAVRQRERFNNVWDVFSQVHELPARELMADVRKLEKFSSKDVIGDCKNGAEIGRLVRAAKLALL